MESSPRPQSIDWKLEWKMAKAQTNEWNLRSLKLERQVHAMQSTYGPIKAFLEYHELESIDKVEEFVRSLEDAIEEGSEENARLCTSWDELNETCSTLKASIKEYEDQLSTLNEAFESTKDENIALNTQIRNLSEDQEKHAQQVKCNMNSLLAELQAAERTNDELRTNCNKLQGELDAKVKIFEAQGTEMGDKLESLEQALGAAVEEKQEILSTNQELKSRWLALSTDFVALEEQNALNQVKLEEFDSRMVNLTHIETMQKDYIAKLEQDVDCGQRFFTQLAQCEVTIQSLESQVLHLKEQDDGTRKECQMLQNEVANLNEDFEKTKADNLQLYQQLKVLGDSETDMRAYILQLEAENGDSRSKIESMKDHYEHELSIMQSESNDRLEATRQIEALQSMLREEQELNSHKSAQMAETEGLVNMKMDIISELRREIVAHKSVIIDQKLRIETHENAKIIEKDHVRQNEELRRQINAALESREEVGQKLQMESSLRRKLQEQLLEMKGTIRVFCRLRPLAANEMFREGGLIFDTQSSTISVCQTTNGYNSTNSRVSKFTFDQIFDATSTNKDIFQEVDLLIQSIFNGFSCCIFAYGQTGSGKSHTMLSPDGIVPRTIENIFRLMKITGHESVYTIYASFFEIYNEQVIDLTGNSGARKGFNGRTPNSQSVGQHLVTTTEELIQVLELGLKNRAVGATKMNKDSSRSHTVFSIKVESVNLATGLKTSGKLNLVDLAGSERLDKSQVTGQQLKETQAINKSLSALGDVIHALSQNPKAHIPFRNSKLTHMLQDSLVGKSKTLMLVNVSPALSSMQETLTSLRFAEKVNSTKLRDC